MHKGDEPHVLVDLANPHVLARKYLTEIQLPILKQMRPHVVTVLAQSCNG